MQKKEYEIMRPNFELNFKFFYISYLCCFVGGTSPICLILCLKMIYGIYMIYSRVHVGANLIEKYPVGKHSAVFGPLCTYPLSHEYLKTVPQGKSCFNI